MAAFRSFQQRHSATTKVSKASSATKAPRPQHVNKPYQSKKPPMSEYKPPATKKIKQSNPSDHLSLRSIGNIISPIPSIPISPISPLRATRSRTQCTPLTDDFENGLMESERKSRQKQKKYEFRSRKRKSTHSNVHSNVSNVIKSATKPTARSMTSTISSVQSTAKTLLHPNFRSQLSPILDVEETSMTMSITPITPNNRQVLHNMDNSVNMDLSGISDISSIANNDTVLSEAHFVLTSPDRKRKPELPPTMPSADHAADAPLVPITPQSLNALNSLNSVQSKPLRFSPPVSALTSKPSRRIGGELVQDADILNISDRFGSIEIGNSPSRRSGKENEQGSSNRKRGRKMMRDGEGSMVRMEVICVSPSRSNKYGSNKVVSPVRRSKRIQQIREEEGLEDKDVQKLLKQSNYHYVPNPMLNTSQNM